MRASLTLTAGCILFAGAPFAKATEAADSGFGETQLQLRMRIETVDENVLPADATATTLRTRLTWTSPGWNSWRAVIEADDIRALDDDAYNSTINGMTSRPVVADPAGTELNRAALEWQQGDWNVVLGRQRIVLDDQRFIGNVGWRQNEQTFDAATLRWKASKRVDVDVGWIANVNRVFGPRSGAQAADWRSNSPIAHATARLDRFGQLTVFWYGLDFDNASESSNATAGLLWRGTAHFDGGWKLPWLVSVANQSDYGDNPTDYSARYQHLEIGMAKGPLGFKLGREIMTGDATTPQQRFQTPLATLHAFQGWADKFLVAPPQGIEDRYAMLEANWRGFSAQLLRHDFRAEAVARRYGTEWDASVSRKVGKRWELLGKLADYEAVSFGSDTRKAWLQLTATF